MAASTAIYTLASIIALRNRAHYLPGSAQYIEYRDTVATQLSEMDLPSELLELLQ